LRSDKERLLDMMEAIEKMEKYSSLGYPAFLSEERNQIWVIHYLQVIGEAANYLSDDLTTKYSDIPWADIVGLRNLLVHQYFGIDLERVWETVEHDIPVLKSRVEEILKEIDD
jgi:uncharacterized protein with HEPN domain